jgi:NADP-dependent aldehyde dehydrogenase
VGLALVRNPITRAVGFTGSLRAGRALFDAAAARPEPIPVYAEMGSTNPVFVLPGALEERGAAIATALGDSATLGIGQFCTKPGLIFAVAGPACDRLAGALAERIEGKPAARMLYPALAARFLDGIEALGRTRGVRRLGQVAAPPARDAQEGMAQPVAWQVDLTDFLWAPALREETFGPSTILVRAAEAHDLVRAARTLEGQLTATLYGTPADLAGAAALIDVLERKVGRLVFNGVPTGVEVGAAMNHGGPYPATTDVRSTSVGTAAILRFARPLCYQDAVASVLPPELGDRNVRGIWRLVDNRWTRDDVEARS